MVIIKGMLVDVVSILMSGGVLSDKYRENRVNNRLNTYFCKLHGGKGPV